MMPTMQVVLQEEQTARGTQVSVTSTEFEEEKEDRKANDGVQASQNGTLKKKDTGISKVKSSVSGATGIHSLCASI